jgi:hypothetical protein
MSNVIGVVVLSRHGDRQGFYQTPESYTPSNTAITPLGEVQEFELGALLRRLYVAPGSTTQIQNISTGLFDQAQVMMRADAGGEGGVIFDSSIALAQGLWPATGLANTTLANGTTVTSPLSGYQYIPVESVEPAQDITLEGWTLCNAFTKATTDTYNSPAFQQKAQEHKDFLANLVPYVGGRPVSLQNIWNIFDFMNVQSIHNKTFNDALPPTFLAQARDLANFHEYYTFSSPSPDGIGNIAGRTIIPSVIGALDRIANASDPLKFASLSISYKPFISLFNMTGMVQSHPELAGLVNYAAALSMELHQPSGAAEPTIRLNFKNGTDDANFKNYAEMPYSQFKSSLAPHTVTLKDWCRICNNTVDRGCALVTAANGGGGVSASSHHGVSNVGAGFIGFGVTLGVILLALGAAVAVGLISFGKKPKPSEKM